MSSILYFNTYNSYLFSITDTFFLGVFTSLFQDAESQILSIKWEGSDTSSSEVVLQADSTPTVSSSSGADNELISESMRTTSCLSLVNYSFMFLNLSLAFPEIFK